MFTIAGVRIGNERVVRINGVTMKPSPKALTISPDGYNWGYSGSGPRALCYDLVERLMPMRMRVQTDDYGIYIQTFIERILCETSQEKDFEITITRDFLEDQVWKSPYAIRVGSTANELFLEVEGE